MIACTFAAATEADQALLAGRRTLANVAFADDLTLNAIVNRLLTNAARVKSFAPEISWRLLDVAASIYDVTPGTEYTIWDTNVEFVVRSFEHLRHDMNCRPSEVLLFFVKDMVELAEE